MQIAYREGYKFQLYWNYHYQTKIMGVRAEIPGKLFLDTDGILIVYAGYAWDGASGPAIDTNNFMRGSLIHDALYQLIGEGMLPFHYRRAADDILIKICKEDGMSAPRRWWVKLAVNTFGARALEFSNPVVCAPGECK